MFPSLAIPAPRFLLAFAIVLGSAWLPAPAWAQEAGNQDALWAKIVGGGASAKPKGSAPAPHVVRPSRPKPAVKSAPVNPEYKYKGYVGDTLVDVELDLDSRNVTGTMSFVRSPDEVYTLEGDQPPGEMNLRVANGAGAVARVHLTKDPNPKKSVDWRGTLTLNDGRTKSMTISRPLFKPVAVAGAKPNIYQGTVGGAPAEFNLIFNGGTVTGSYFKLASPSFVIQLEGTNPSKVLVLREHDSTGAVSAEIILHNKESATEIRWEGVMQNIRENSLRKEVVFSRPK